MKILVVDDEKNIRENIVKYLKLENIESVPAGNGLSAKRILSEEAFDAAIIDLRMPGMDGLELLKWINDENQQIPVIMISAYGEISDAVEAMKQGASDYIVKPFDPEELVIRLKRIVEKQKMQNEFNAGKRFESLDKTFIGESQSILEIKKLISKIADTNSSVLITGESGTGKEVAAKSIHNLSDRKNNPFIPINIGGIPESLLESELFGYEKGAFTGANNKKLGMFELASSGTLFLDEIGDMPMQLQVKLLRVLQDRKIQRLGSVQTIPIDVRIIAATNKNIKQSIKEKTFREDLFFRLNVINIELPPLRDRIMDIPLLVGFFIKKLSLSINKPEKKISDESLEALKQYSFPGNIRELENILERAFILCETDLITPADLGISIKKNNKINGSVKMKKIEKQAIIEALHRWDGNRTKAAEELGISRRTIINKIKEYDLEKED